MGMLTKFYTLLFFHFTSSKKITHAQIKICTTENFRATLPKKYNNHRAAYEYGHMIHVL